MTETAHHILVVGTGSIGERHVRCYLATGRAQVSVCEVNEQRRQEVADQYDLAGVYADLDEALAGPCSAVLIATPAHTHIPIARKVVAAGRHVVIEKPLSTSLEGISELQQEIQQQNVVAAVSYQLRAHPVVQGMKQALESGQFGRPLQLYATSGQDFAFYRPAYAQTYFADHSTGGGAIQDAITHTLNLSEWLVGPMTSLVVDAAHKQLPNVTVEDTVHLLARHGEVMAGYTLNMYQAPNESQITVVCEGGTVRFEARENRWRVMTDTEGAWQDSEHMFEDRDAWYIQNAAAMLDALERNQPPLCSLEDALQTLRVNLAALKSLETRTWQDV